MATEQSETRVRFSAEGMAEVVAAFKSVSTAGKQSAKETSDAFAQLKGQFSELGRYLIGGLGLVLVAEQLKELFKGALDTAEGLTRLSRQTGLSTDAIQAFQRAARETGLSSETANNAIEKFTVQLGKASLGSKQSASALTDLGLSTKELLKLTPDERLLLVAQRLAGIPEPARRARDEVALFGKGAQETDQALVKLGNEGITGFINRLKELGLYLDTETIAQLKAAKEQLRDIGDTGKGLGTQFLVGLLPGLTAATEGLTKASGAGEGFKAVGAAIGSVLLFLQQGFQGWGLFIGAVAARVGVAIQTVGTVAYDVAHGKFAQATEDMKSGMRQLDAIAVAFREDQKKLEDEIANGPKKRAVDSAGPGAPTTQTVTPPDLALGKARLDLIKAQLDNELKLFEANSQLELDTEKGRYQAGEISLKEYFDNRARIINAEFDKRIEIAQKKLAAEEKLPVDINNEAAAVEKLAKEEQLRGQVAELQAQRQSALAAESNNLAEQERSVKERQISAEEKLLTLEGKKTEAARLRLQVELEALAKELQASGASPGEIAGVVGQARDSGEAKIGYDAATEKAKADLSLLETQKKALQDQVNSGQKFSIQGEQELLDLERQRLPALEADAKAMLDFARKSQDPATIAAAEAFNEKVKEIATSTDLAGQRMKELRACVESSIGAGINTFLTDAIKNSKNLGQAFDNAAKQIFDDLVKLAIKLEEEKLLKALFGGGAGAGGGGFFGALLGFSGGGQVDAGGSGSVHAASGGLIRGPGSTTSDSIPAFVSDREYIVNAKATQAPGVLPLLELINQGATPLRAPRFAGGGAVSVGGHTFRQTASSSAAPAVVLKVHPDALHLTLRDWFEREVADIAAKR